MDKYVWLFFTAQMAQQSFIQNSPMMQSPYVAQSFRHQMAAPQLSQVLAPQYLRASNGFGGFSSFPQNFASHNTMSFASPRNMAPMTPFNDFTTTAYQMPAMIPSSSSCSVGGYDQPMGLYGGFSSTEPNHPQQWHFDSGAIHHSTNNWNNIDQPQPTPVTKGGSCRQWL